MDIMAKVFANVCFWNVFVVFECSASFSKRCEEVWILCVQVFDLCVRFWKKKRQSFENECKELKKNYTFSVLGLGKSSKWPLTHHASVKWNHVDVQHPLVAKIQAKISLIVTSLQGKA